MNTKNRLPEKKLSLGVAIVISAILGGLAFVACKKDKTHITNVPELSTNNSAARTGTIVEYYYVNGGATSQATFPNDTFSTDGHEYLEIIRGDTINGDTIFHHFFSTMANMETWASTYNGADLVMSGIHHFDSLRDRAIATGEIEYYETHHSISSSMEEYLINGNYNYVPENQANARIKSGLGFFKKDCTTGSALPCSSYPFLNNFDNNISFQESVVAGVISLYDKTWFRKRLTTLWFVAYTSKTYCGQSYNDKASSINVSI